MMVSEISDLISDLKGFSGKREVMKALRREIRSPLPEVRKAVKSHAKKVLPRGGGLGEWVAGTRISVSVRLSSGSIIVKVTGARSSLRKKSDLRSLNRGRVRHPSWGRRRKDDWHIQLVKSGFFSTPVRDAPWREACIRAVNTATKMIRG